jgi:carbon starvation protein
LAYAWTTLVPLAWLLAVTMTAGYQKILSPDPAIGFLAQAAKLGAGLAAGSVPADKSAAVRVQIFNFRLDAAVTAVFMALVALIVVEATRACLRALGEARPPDAISETLPLRRA